MTDSKNDPKNTPKNDPHEPLASRLRPRSIDDIVGQRHLVGPEGWLRRSLELGRVPSLILWGPPGVGKSTLAQLVCWMLDAETVHLSAVLAGVKDIRAAIEKAKLAQQHGKKTIIFVDEIHRFSKSQQDVLLPHVESGLITLIGATTENPSFSINSALLSRCSVAALKPLDDGELGVLLKRACVGQKPLVDDKVEKALIHHAAGDARRMLSTFEIAETLAEAQGTEAVTLQQVEDALGQKTLRYDRAGDMHYDVISLFIKSMRRSDVQAACYYLALMLEAGEDPLFVLRRMVLFASEDVGNADPRALPFVVSALSAYQLAGMPEGYLPLVHAVTYLASTRKSRAVYEAYHAAKADVAKHNGGLEVPPDARYYVHEQSS